MDDSKLKPAEKLNSEKQPPVSAASKETQRALKRLKTTLVDVNIGETVKRLRSGPKDEGGPIILRIAGGVCEAGGGAQAEKEEPKATREARDTAKKADQAQGNKRRSRSMSRGRRGRSVSRVTNGRSSSAARRSRSPSASTRETPAKRTRLRSRSRGPSERIKAFTKEEIEELSSTDIVEKFCWNCHKRDTHFDCTYCPRSFHTRCISAADLAGGVCPECDAGFKSERKTFRLMEPNPLERLRPMLAYTLDAMKYVVDSQHFCKPVDSKEHPRYAQVIRNPMDLEKLDMNLRNGAYGSTAAFHADAKWIQHNSIIYNSSQSHYTSVAKQMLRVCKQELDEIDKCPDCYMNAHNCDDWFIQVCKRPHMLIWARLKGHPFWPAKVLAFNAKQQTVDARFFGAHDKAWVPVKDCYLLSKNSPPSACKKKGEFEAAYKEMSDHIANITTELGSFVFASDKVAYLPEIEDQQLSSMMPGWKPTSRKVSSEKESGEDAIAGVVADMDGICEREKNIGNNIEEGEVVESPASNPDGAVIRTPEHGYSIKEDDKIPLSPKSNPVPAQAPPKPPASPKNKSVKPEATSSEQKKIKSHEKPEYSSEAQEEVTEKEVEKSGITDIEPPAEATTPKSVEIGKTRQPMVTIVDINRLGVKAASSSAGAGAEGPKHKPGQVSYVMIEDNKTGAMKTVVLNPMAKSNKARKSLPQSVLQQDNAITISTSSAATSKGPNHGFNVIAVDTKNSDAQRTLLKTLAANEDKSSSASEESPSTEDAGDGDGDGADTASTPSAPSIPTGPILISQNGQAYIAGPSGTVLTQGQFNLVQLAGMPGHSGYVNIDGLTGPGGYPLLPATPCQVINGSLVVGSSVPSSSGTCTPVSVLTAPRSGGISVKKTLFDPDPIEAEVKKHMPKLTETLQDAVVRVLKSIGDSLPAVQMRIINAERDNVKRQHQKVVDEMRIEMDKSKKKLESEFQRKLGDKQFELDKIHEDYKRVIEQTKQKQWCALCRKEALFYCCWNTSYCDYPCQQQHWPTHMTSCSQISQPSQGVTSSTVHQARKKLGERNNGRAGGGGPSFDPASIAEAQLQSPPSVPSTYNGPASRKKQ